MQDEPFPESRSKDQFGAMKVGNLMLTNTNTFNKEPELPGEEFHENIKHFKVDVMMLK